MRSARCMAAMMAAQQQQQSAVGKGVVGEVDVDEQHVAVRLPEVLGKAGGTPSTRADCGMKACKRDAECVLRW